MDYERVIYHLLKIEDLAHRNRKSLDKLVNKHDEPKTPAVTVPDIIKLAFAAVLIWSVLTGKSDPSTLLFGK